MKYGIREVCNMKFYKYNSNGDHSTLSFEIDTARTSTLESSTTTVYAQGGRGHSRLMSWEGERTLTFTVEDALFTSASLSALMGTKPVNNRISLTTTDFAGYYFIEAETLIRNEFGVDVDATIRINKAKLQSNINIPMASSGDPAAFTFTFDAFPVDGEFLTIESTIFNEAATSDTKTTITIVKTDGTRVKKEFTGASDIELKIDDEEETKTISLGGVTTGIVLENDQELSCFYASVTPGQSITIEAGTSSTWYIV